MTSDRTSLMRRQPLLASFAAVAFLAAFGLAQAQSSTSPTQVNPSATDSNREASQGMQPSQGDTRTGTMRSDRSSGSTTSSGTQGSSGSMTAQSGATGSPTQVNPSAQDSNREASQGMVPGRTDDTARSRINAPDSDLRNDRTTMARAPRADRN